MDINDFVNNDKYKIVLPILYMVSIAMMLTLPFFYPHLYRYYIFAVWTYGAYKGTQTFVLTVIACFKGYFTLRRAEKFMEKKANAALGKTDGDDQTQLINSLTDEVVQPQKKFLHAFIIPNYKEDPEIIGDTLQQLATHTNAKQRYMVFLAMEAHEEGSAEKAQRLIQQHGHNFKVMSFSHHKFKEPEAKGKASNVSWCAEHLEKDEFEKRGINPDEVFLTIIDVDSWVPEFYVKEMDDHISAHPDNCLDYTYQPCQTFTRNWLNVPALARTYDQMHSTAQMSNLVSSCEQGYAISNYSISFNMMKRIGFWDTCADAIGEDMHTFLKATLKTNGKLRTHPIFTPFNQLNVETDKGYFEGIKARFWQAERHARGCADFAYMLNFIFRKDRPAMTFRTMNMIAGLMEVFVLPSVLPWCAVGFWVLQIAQYFGFQEATPSVPDEWLVNLMNIGTSMCGYAWIIYFFYSRWASRLFYNIHVPIYRIVEMPLLLIFNMVFISTPTFVIAAFKIWMGKNVYDVAEKKSKSAKSIEAPQSAEESTQGSTVSL